MIPTADRLQGATTGTLSIDREFSKQLIHTERLAVDDGWALKAWQILSLDTTRIYIMDDRCCDIPSDYCYP
jgi:hypothetical protein